MKGKKISNTIGGPKYMNFTEALADQNNGKSVQYRNWASDLRAESAASTNINTTNVKKSPNFL